MANPMRAADDSDARVPVEAAESASPTRGRQHVLVQATVPALDVDGRTAAIVGTVCFALATVVVAIWDDRHHANGTQWGLWSCVTGVGLGLFMLAYCELRRWQAEEPAGVE